MYPIGFDADAAKPRRRRELEEIEDRRLVLVRPVVDPLSSLAALREQDADLELGAAEPIFSAAQPNRIAGRDFLLRTRDRRKRLGERAGIGVIAVRMNVEFGGGDRVP